MCGKLIVRVRVSSQSTKRTKLSTIILLGYNVRIVSSSRIPCDNRDNTELQKSHEHADIVREEGLQNGRSVRKVSSQQSTHYINVANTDIKIFNR